MTQLSQLLLTSIAMDLHSVYNFVFASCSFVHILCVQGKDKHDGKK